MEIDKYNSNFKLSKRELQVIEGLLDGLPLKIISKKLDISERTVKFHCNNIYKKINVKNRVELISTQQKR